jgi:hypothetical protein
MEQELFALPGHMSSLRSLGGHVTLSLVLCAMFCRSLFGHCVVCPSTENRLGGIWVRTVFEVLLRSGHTRLFNWRLLLHRLAIINMD